MITRRILMAGSLAGLATPAVHAAEALEDVTLAVSSTSFVLGGVKIGQEAGLFAQHGLNLKITVMDSGNAAMSALIGGSVPFSVAGPSEVLAARVRGQDVVIAANLYAGFAGAVVLGKPVAAKLGVAETAPVQERLRALDGIVLATPSATSALTAPVREAASAAGAKVRFTYMAQGAMPAALESGAVQGIDASFPFAGAPLVRGTGVLWIDGPGGELPPEVSPASSSCVQATTAYVKANQPTVRKLQQAIIAIAAYIEKDQDAAKRALAAGYPQLAAQELDLAFRKQWRNWTKPFLTEADMRQELKLLISSTHMPGLEKLDVTQALIGKIA